MDATRDLLVARIALERGLVTRAVVEDALHLQGQVSRLGLPVTLAFVLENKGHLSGEQAAGIEREAAERAHRGTQVGTIMDGDGAAGTAAEPAAARPSTHASAPSPSIDAGFDGGPLRSGVSAPAGDLAKLVRNGEVREIGRYQVVREIGRGAMGIVYEALQENPRRAVALKVVSGDALGPKALTRFHREAEAVGRLNHPNIVKVYEAGEVDGVPFLAMELVEGRSLERLSTADRLPCGRAAHVFEQAADAIHYAHTQGIIHRDLKPGNLMLGPSDRVIITDFGLARDLSAVTLTATGAIMGTPMYMPPEQAEGKVDELDARSDIYALGASLYEVLTGHPLFAGESVATVIGKVIGEEPRSLRAFVPEIPRELEWIVLKTLRKEKERRYQTAAELRDDLRRFREGNPVLARPTSILHKTVRTVKRNRLASAAVAGALALVAIAGSAYRFQVERHRLRTEALNGAEAQVRSGNLDEGLKLLDALVARDPGFADGFLARGRLLARLGRLEPARGSLARAVELAPESPEAWTEMGIAERHAGERTRAREAFDRALALQSNYALARVERGELTGGPEAAADFESVRAGQAPDPLRARAECGLGAIALAAGKAAEAQQGFERAHAIAPETSDPFEGIAECRAAQRDFAGAETAYQKAQELDPLEPRLPLRRAFAAVRAGDPERALQTIAEAAKLAAGDAQVEFLRALAGPADAVGERLDRCLAADPRHRDARIWRAVRRMDAGDAAGAAADLEGAGAGWADARSSWRAGRLDDGRKRTAAGGAETALLRARWAADAGDLAGSAAALAEFERTAAASPELGLVLYVDAGALFAQLNAAEAPRLDNRARRDLKRVVFLCEKATALVPELAHAHLLRGRAWLELGRWREGLEALGRAIEVQPALVEARGWRAFFHVMLLDFTSYSGAQEDLDVAFALQPREPRWPVFRAELRLARRDRPGAIADVQSARALAPKLASPRWLEMQLDPQGGGAQVLNRYLSEWRTLDGDRPASRFLEYAAESALDAGDVYAAAMLFETALAEDPGNGGALLVYGQFLERSGNPMLGMYVQFRAGEIHPDFALRAYFRWKPLVRQLSLSGQLNPTTLSLALTQVPDSSVRDVMTGFTFYSLKRLDLALGQFDKALKKEPGSMVARCFKGATLCLTGNTAEARAILLEAQKIHPTSAMPLYFLAGVEASEGKQASAIDLLGKCLAFGFPEASETIRDEAFFKDLKDTEEFKKLMTR